MTVRSIKPALLATAFAAVCVSPAYAQDQSSDQTSGGEGGESTSQRGNRAVQPYIEVSQIVSAQLTPGDEVLTFTQLAAGVDINVQGRNSGAAVSVRYERNIAYGDDSVDSDTISGVARSTIAVVPGALTIESGLLASRKP